MPSACMVCRVPEALLRPLTSAMLSATTRIQGTHTTFSTTCGVKQGCPLSPLIFVVYYGIVLRKVQALQVPVTAFIDNLTAVLPLSRLGDRLQSISAIISASGMVPNALKTHTLPIRVPIDRVESIIKTLDTQPKANKSFLRSHLGHPMHASISPASVYAIVQAGLS